MPKTNPPSSPTPPVSQPATSKPSSSSLSPVQQQIMNRLSKLQQASSTQMETIETKFKELESKREADQAKLIQSVTSVATIQAYLHLLRSL